MKVLNVFSIFACLGLVTSQGSYYCGRRLASALDTFCQGHLMTKRAAPQDSGFAPEWPWMEASKAHGVVYMRKRGVVDECCEKPCTVEDLMAYCG